jgi:hypothetical protein
MRGVKDLAAFALSLRLPAPTPQHETAGPRLRESRYSFDRLLCLDKAAKPVDGHQGQD